MSIKGNERKNEKERKIKNKDGHGHGHGDGTWISANVGSWELIFYSSKFHEIFTSQILLNFRKSEDHNFRKNGHFQVYLGEISLN